MGGSIVSGLASGLAGLALGLSISATAVNCDQIHKLKAQAEELAQLRIRVGQLEAWRGQTKEVEVER